MITKAFCVYDSKALVYGVPMFIPSVGAAVRSFADVCNDPDSVVCKHPSDFVLYEIGEFDDATGRLVAYEPLRNLGNASEFRKVAKEPVVFNPAGLDKKGK